MTEDFLQRLTELETEVRSLRRRQRRVRTLLIVVIGSVVCLLLTAGTVSKPNTFAAGTAISASEVNANFDTLYNLVNGNIDSANLSSDANSIDKITGGLITISSDGAKARIVGALDVSGTLEADGTLDLGGSPAVLDTSPLLELCANGNIWIDFDNDNTSSNASFGITSGNDSTSFLTFREDAATSKRITINGGYSSYSDFPVYILGKTRVGGDLSVSGTLSKGSGSFVIDHPLDPRHKVLRHSFVESPEMLLIYSGRARLEGGITTVQLPEYFDTLNHPDKREISLTCVNGWSPLYLSGPITDNRFTVRTAASGDPEQEFSWVVYGVRNDAFARANPIVVEQAKGEGTEFADGTYMHPEAFE